MIGRLMTSIAAGTQEYPRRAPFDPAEKFPETLFPDRPTDPGNQVYGMVREALHLLGLDEAGYGTPEWNPLGEIVKPGDFVLIKPNFVLHRNFGTGPFEAVVTHASVLRPIVDYVLIALKKRGRIVIGDAPQMNCDMQTLLSGNGMRELAPFLNEACRNQGVQFDLTDFRKEQTYYKHGIVWKRKYLSGRDDKMVPVVLGPESYMEPVRTEALYGADYDRRRTVGAHREHRHEYRIAAEAAACDVIISVPKLKTHSKVGTTLNLKNMVGINADKNHLAHYRVGRPAQGGDEFSNPRWYDRVDRALSDFLLGRHWKWGKYPFVAWRWSKKVLEYGKKSPTFAFGNWHGNDTAWRMTLDLNRVLLCSDKQGKMSPSPRRRYFTFIDGIVGGQGDGPLHPDSYPSGVILAGFNPLVVDWVGTLLMGLDPARINLYARGAEQMQEWLPEFSTDRIEVRSNRKEFEGLPHRCESPFQFAPAPGWRDRIEFSYPKPGPEVAAETSDAISQ